jgi:hypothetical protein
MEHPRRHELDFRPFVVFDRIAAAHVEQVVRADVMHVADAQREATTPIGILEERVPMEAAVHSDVFDLVHNSLTRADGIRVQRRDLLGLGLLDQADTARLLRLGAHGPARSEQKGNTPEKCKHSTNAHRCVEVRKKHCSVPKRI